MVSSQSALGSRCPSKPYRSKRMPEPNSGTFEGWDDDIKRYKVCLHSVNKYLSSHSANLKEKAVLPADAKRLTWQVIIYDDIFACAVYRASNKLRVNINLLVSNRNVPFCCNRNRKFGFGSRFGRNQNRKWIVNTLVKIGCRFLHTPVYPKGGGRAHKMLQLRCVPYSVGFRITLTMWRNYHTMISL